MATNESFTCLVKKVIVHPLVLLSAVDHSDRVLRDRSSTDDSRVVGVLLGSLKHGILDISNCFALPFEEDSREPEVWFLDHNYLETMFSMFRKVNAREKIVGWYHTGISLCKNDIDINEILRKYNNNAVLVRIRVKNFEVDSSIPVEAFYAVDEIHDDGSPISKTFQHIPAEIDAEEAEEVGVEHLLRDIRDSTTSSLTQKVVEQVESLSGLADQLKCITEYLEDVVQGALPVNHQVMYQLQEVVNLMPDMSRMDLQGALRVNINDEMVVLYISSLVRSILAIHDLIDNKLKNREEERQEYEERKKQQLPSAAGAGDAGANVDKSGKADTPLSGGTIADSDKGKKAS